MQYHCCAGGRPSPVRGDSARKGSGRGSIACLSGQSPSCERSTLIYVDNLPGILKGGDLADTEKAKSEFVDVEAEVDAEERQQEQGAAHMSKSNNKI
jgi:hypothetical protein